MFWRRSSSPAEKLIVPGEKAGPVTLGMAMEDVRKVLGPPQDSAIPGVPNSRTYRYPGRFSMQISDVPDASVMTILCETDDYRTAEGLGVGSSGRDVLSAFGRDYWMIDYAPGAEELGYHPQGIAFCISPDNRVEGVRIYHPFTPGPGSRRASPI